MKIEIGTRYNHLVLVKDLGVNDQGKQIGLWKCDCGKEKIITFYSVHYQNAKSCGCLQKNKAAKIQGYDLLNEKFGDFLVIEKTDMRLSGSIKWKCKCQKCGHIQYISTRDLKKKINRNCSKCSHKKTENKCRGGLSISQKLLYVKWAAMRNHRNGAKAYENIHICKEWEDDFPAFLEWALKNGYEKGLSIDRIDPEKGYEPKNCRWISPEKNASLARSAEAVYIEIDGEVHNQSEWARLIGKAPNTVSTWMNKKGTEYAKSRIRELYNQAK